MFKIQEYCIQSNLTYLDDAFMEFFKDKRGKLLDSKNIVQRFEGKIFKNKIKVVTDEQILEFTKNITQEQNLDLPVV